MKLREAVESTKRDLTKGVRDLIVKRPLSRHELAEELHCKVTEVNGILSGLRGAGANISELVGGKIFLNSLIQHGGSLTLQAQDRGDGWTVVGFITDNHLGNRHSRLDVLNAAYDFFEREGVTDVLNGGNWVDGEARFNRHELIVAPRDGPPTEMRAQKAGRNDLHYLGHVEADIRLKCGRGSAVGRLMHPGGGSAYALSYAPQKLVEAFQGGEKPAVLWIGHYHKFDWCYPREVHCISGGCTTDQSAFLRKNKIGVHVGFGMTKIQQDRTDGHITRVQHEWVPFYDRGYYERRFG